MNYKALKCWEKNRLGICFKNIKQYSENHLRKGNDLKKALEENQKIVKRYCIC